MTSLIATDLRAQADRRIHDAVTEAREQLAKGWQPHQVLAVMEDAADIVADLWEQAEAADELAALVTERDQWLRAHTVGFGWVEDAPGRCGS